MVEIKSDRYLLDLLVDDEIAMDDTVAVAEDDATSPTWTGPSTTRCYSGFFRLIKRFLRPTILAKRSKKALHCLSLSTNLVVVKLIT